MWQVSPCEARFHVAFLEKGSPGARGRKVSSERRCRGWPRLLSEDAFLSRFTVQCCWGRSGGGEIVSCEGAKLLMGSHWDVGDACGMGRLPEPFSPGQMPVGLMRPMRAAGPALPFRILEGLGAKRRPHCPCRNPHSPAHSSVLLAVWLPGAHLHSGLQRRPSWYLWGARLKPELRGDRCGLPHTGRSRVADGTGAWVCPTGQGFGVG